MKKLEEYRDDLERCVKCGTCKTGCPSYTVAQREWASARGRVSLIKAHLDGDVDFSEKYLRQIKECTLCGACSSACPNEVPVPSIIMAARAEQVEAEGLPTGAAFVMKRILDSKRLGPLALKAASKLQGIVFKDAGGMEAMEQSGLVSRFQIPYMPIGCKDRLVPGLAKTFFMDTRLVKNLKKEHGKGARSGVKVAFFAGCAINYLLPRIGEASLKLLNEAGAVVIVPSAQVCCGMPALSLGDTDTAKSLALKNLEAFEAVEADFITTSCATCTRALKDGFMAALTDDPSLTERVLSFSAKVRDITELLANEFNIIPRLKGADSKTVTYHDPCHLGRGEGGIRDEPRELIEKSGHAFREMKHPCGCCGLGGGVSFTNYDLSMEIMRSKAENIKDTGADILATACPGCMIQIKDGLNRFEVKADVKHVVELF